MADYKITCKGCQNELSFPDEMLNQSVECPACNSIIKLTAPPATIEQGIQEIEPEKRTFDKKKTVFEKRVNVELVNNPGEISAAIKQQKTGTPEVHKAKSNASEQQQPETPQTKSGLWHSLTNMFKK